MEGRGGTAVLATFPQAGSTTPERPSGAGKSTLIGALTGLRPASRGRVSWAGRDLHAEYDQRRFQVGLVPQEGIIDRQLTVARALRFAAELRLPPDIDRAARIDEVLEEVKLTPQQEQRIDSLSGGQRKRTSIALESLTAPQLLFLDEPTSGLDPGLDRQVMSELRVLADSGRVVVVVTDSVQALDVCDQVLLLAPGGRVAFFSPPEKLLPSFEVPDYPAVFGCGPVGRVHGAAVADRRGRHGDADGGLRGGGCCAPVEVGAADRPSLMGPGRRPGAAREARVSQGPMNRSAQHRDAARGDRPPRRARRERAVRLRQTAAAYQRFLGDTGSAGRIADRLRELDTMTSARRADQRPSARRCATLGRMAGATAADAFAERTWGVAYRLLSQVPPADLTPADLDRLAVAAYLIGEDDEAVSAWEHAYKRHADAGERAEAARCAFWAAFSLQMRGQMAHAGGWLSRGRAVLGGELDCPARGYLLIPVFLAALGSDDAEEARRLAVQLEDIAVRFRDADLAALSTLGHGQALLAMGEEADGQARLDEAMLAVCGGEVGPIVSGIVYCAVILECLRIFDLARAAEWTAALDEWCRGQPDLVPYRGQCLVHRSQLRQAAGDWADAAVTVAAARERLSHPPHPALGLACYQEGELCRLRGDVRAAADAYRRASGAGHEPMPGLALLELQRGDATSAAVGIGRSLREAGQRFQRPGLLAAAVEIRVAAGDLAGAAEAAAELVTIAGLSSSPVLEAMAAQASGAVLLASEQITDAVVRLREAGATWQRLAMPYEAARNAVLVGLGCAASGDSTSAALQFSNARAVFESLGAGPDLRRVDQLAGGPLESHALSARELEVLVLVAEGRTSREVASSLGISQHTVRRHLENTFAKLGVTTRAAAVAYAYQHDLL